MSYRLARVLVWLARQEPPSTYASKTGEEPEGVFSANGIGSPLETR